MAADVRLEDYVLLVILEDKEIDIIKKQLESLDDSVEVECFSDPIKAISRAGKRPPKVLISSDYFAPGSALLNGAQLAGAVKGISFEILTLMYSPNPTQSRLFDGYIEQSNPSGDEKQRHKDLIEALSSSQLFGIRCHDGQTYSVSSVPNVRLHRGK